MQIYLVRHTTPAIAKGICYGQTDIGLDENLFDEEFKTILTKLPNGIEQFYTSPLIRCIKLTEKLSEIFTEDKRLMELNFGDWENKNWNDIDQHDVNVWMQDFVNIAPSGGENYANLHSRTLQFIDSLLVTKKKSAAIVTHAGNIRSFIASVLELPLKNSFRIHLDYGAVIALKIYKDKCLNQLISIK